MVAARPAALLLLVACSSSSAPAERRLGASRAEPATIPAAVRPAARPPAGLVLDLPGDARGAVWDAATGTLFVTDDTHSAIVKWTDAGGFAPVATVPPADKVGLGGLVLLPDAQLVTVSFGFGRDGGVFALDPARAGARAIPALDPARRRLAVTRGPLGELYVGYFVVEANSRRRGGIARLDLSDVARGETDAITTGLAKPVGVVASATTLYVADAEQRAIFAYSLTDLTTRRVLAHDLAAADLLTLLPDGDLVTGGGTAVQRVTASGRVIAIADGFEQVRGTAYDEAQRRLFVVEHSVASSRHRLHVLRLD